MKARIIAVANQKGGVGKTASVAAIGALLAKRGYRTLIIDLDTQANLTSSLLRETPGEELQTIGGALRGLYSLPQYPIKGNLYIAPSDSELGRIETDLAGIAEREYILRDLLQTAAPDYSFILLDCPPSLSLITRSAFTAANIVLVPMTAEALPAQGLSKVEETIEETKQRTNKGLSLGGVFLTRWESSRLSKRIEELLRQSYGDKVFSSRIRKNIAIAESPLLQLDITEYAPGSNGARDYEALTEELLRRLKIEGK